MILNDLIPSPKDRAREAVNDPCSHLDNRADGVKNEVGYIVIERTSHLVGSYASLVFDQVDCSLWIYCSTAWWPAGPWPSSATDPMGLKDPLKLLYSPMILSLVALNALLAFSLIGSGTWFTNQLYDVHFL